MPSWPEIQAGIFAGESGGDYDALFGFSNRPGGRFGNTRLSDMTVADAINFSDPSGPYAQWVKNKIGRVATPMGAYQIVGSTLRDAAKALNLRGDEVMDRAMQDRLGQYILSSQGTGAWEGYKGPQTPDPYAGLPDGPKGQEEYQRMAPPLPPPYEVEDKPIFGIDPDEGRTEMANVIAKKPTLAAAVGKGLGAVGTAYGKARPVRSGARAIPAARVDAPEAPPIDAQVAEMQRQQLAQALARLNSGSLV